MTNPFAFQGKLGRLPYALVCAALFAAQYAVALAVIVIGKEDPYAYWSALLTPLRPIAFLDGGPVASLGPKAILKQANCFLPSRQRHGPMWKLNSEALTWH